MKQSKASIQRLLRACALMNPASKKGVTKIDR
jgi:hypothetical protein